MTAICACCRAPVGAVWSATVPSGFVICGNAGCEHWARARGEGIWGERKPPPPSRRRPGKTCEQCGRSLPITRDQFRDGQRRYCSLTCVEKSGDGFVPAPIPSRPVDVQHHDGPGWRWVCARCSKAATGDPARRDGNSWYCAGCTA